MVTRSTVYRSCRGLLPSDDTRRHCSGFACCGRQKQCARLPAQHREKKKLTACPHTLVHPAVLAFWSFVRWSIATGQLAAQARHTSHGIPPIPRLSLEPCSSYGLNSALPPYGFVRRRGKTVTENDETPWKLAGGARCCGVPASKI